MLQTTFLHGFPILKTFSTKLHTYLAILVFELRKCANVDASIKI